MHIHEFFKTSGSQDPNVLADQAISAVKAGTLSVDDLRPAVYMAASAWSDQQVRETAREAASSRKAVRQAKRAGTAAQIAKAEKRFKSAWASLLDTFRYFGPKVGDKRIGDATISDHEALIEWKYNHEINPAKEVVEEHQRYIEHIRAHNVSTLREAPELS